MVSVETKADMANGEKLILWEKASVLVEKTS